MIDGLVASGNERLPRYSRKEMEKLIQSSFYAYVIPHIWQESRQSVFWLALPVLSLFMLSILFLAHQVEIYNYLFARPSHPQTIANVA